MVLGGVEIPHHRGLLGHSDADVLLHALCDAILGAAGLRDIGHFFPSGDPAWKDADSLMLLAEVIRQVQVLGWKIANVDCVIIAEEPRVGPHVEEMKRRISSVLMVTPMAVGIKATTNERLGFVGRGEGIAALATALLWRG
jgi:2-C-methyl-D-erythritol 2,4-cyclodiphosphate synthase